MTIKKRKQQSHWLWIIPVGLLLALVLVLVFTNGKTTQKSLPLTITVQDAQAQFKNGAFLLDVREASEWNEVHIDGAVLIPLGELSNRISELPTDQDILIICRSGNRSGQARDLLRAAGLMRTTSISGGITAWIAAGLPVVAGP